MKDGLVTLKNGAREPSILVNVAMVVLRRLMSENPIIVFELHEKAKDPNHKIFGNVEQVLRSKYLINPDGSLDDSLKEILLSAIEENDGNMIITNPIKHESAPRPPEPG